MSVNLFKLVMWKRTSPAEVTARAKAEKPTSGGERERVDSLVCLKTWKRREAEGGAQGWF